MTEEEYIKLIETSGSYITPVHINLLVDYQTTMGFLTPISSYGSSKQGVTTLTAAAFQDPVGKFKNAAVPGKKNKISSLSSCIMTGKRFYNGTGFSTVNMEYDSIIKPESRPKPKLNIRPEFCEQNFIIESDTEEKINHVPNEPKMKAPNRFMNLTKKTVAPLQFGPPKSPEYSPYYTTEPPKSPEYSPYSSEEISKSSIDQWIDSFSKGLYDRYKNEYSNIMKTTSSTYKIFENEGAGECFFASVRDGLKNTKSKGVTVSAMRSELSKKATEEVFRNLKDIESQLPEDYDFIKNISTLEEFKDYILTPSYWADEWAISTIEKIYNIKVVILSKVTETIECGYGYEDLVFKPDNYLFMEYTDNPKHYRIVEVNGKRDISFDEIPVEVKIEIINKCMEKDSGAYYSIEDFKNMKLEMSNSLLNLEPLFQEDEPKDSDSEDEWKIPDAPDDDREWNLQDLKF